MSTPPSKPPPPRYLRPILLLLMIMGFSGTLSSCSTINFLHGDQGIRQALDAQLREDKGPLLRVSLVRERQRLDSMAANYQRAFPLAVGRMLLCALLLLTAGAAMRGRAKARPLLLQCLLAIGIFSVISYQFSSPTREAMGRAVAREMATFDTELTAKSGREAAIAQHEKIQVGAENRLLLLELAVYAAAAFALGSKRSRAFLAANEASQS